jgi:hypothetical protein
MGQCTPALQEEVHGEPDYMSKCAAFDSVWLLQSLQKITAGVNKTTNKYYSVFKATKKFYVTQQSPTKGIDEYYNRFENAKDLVGLFNADIVDLILLLAEERKINWSIMNTNKAKYELLWNKLENDLLVGQDSYPETIGDATHLLTNWKASTSPPPATNDHSRRTPGALPAITFAGGETRRPGESTVRGTCADPVPLPANDDFSALTGFDPTHPLAPSKKHPYNISADIECVKCKKGTLCNSASVHRCSLSFPIL